MSAIDERLKNDGYVRTSEAAKAVGVSKATVLRWAADGKVRSRRVGQTCYVERTGVDAFSLEKYGVRPRWGRRVAVLLAHG